MDMIVFFLIEETDARRGVVIYVKKGFKAQEINFSAYETVKDTVWVKLQLEKGELLIGCIYRSPSNKEDMNDQLYKLIKNAIQGRTHILLTGDFNHPEIDWENETSLQNDNHKATIFFESVVRGNFLYQHVKSPTHYRAEQTPTLIDLILTNEEGMVKNVVHSAPLGKSHHQVLSFDFRASAEIEEGNGEARFNYSKGDYNKLKEVIKGNNLCEIIKDLNLTDGWNKFLETYNAAANKCIPKNKGKGKGKQTKRPPSWMNEEVRQALKEKKVTFAKYSKTKDGRDYREYAKARNRARAVCRKAVKNYEKAIARAAQHNPKAFYA